MKKSTWKFIQVDFLFSAFPNDKRSVRQVNEMNVPQAKRTSNVL